MHNGIPLGEAVLVASQGPLVKMVVTESTLHFVRTCGENTALHFELKVQVKPEDLPSQQRDIARAQEMLRVPLHQREVKRPLPWGNDLGASSR